LGHSTTRTYVRQKPKADHPTPTTPTVLRLHPNLEIPEPPPDATPGRLIEYALDCAARFVSPPKVDGEDVEFVCEDVAAAIRRDLLPILLRKITPATHEDAPGTKESAGHVRS
jgi:hypothetical protein